MIEDNVNRIILGIQKIVFNKWVMFTHYEIRYVTQPRLEGAQKLLSKIDYTINNRKVLAFKMIQLYSTQVESQ